MLDAIREAERSVNLLTFVYWQGDIARRFAAEMTAACRRGVEGRVLLDAIGAAKMDEALIEEMRAGGCLVAHFHPPRWNELRRMNRRTHRKVLVVDGRIGFTGGVGIAEEWTGAATDPDHWRDDHFRLRGPAVHHLQGACAQNWRSTTGEVLAGERFFPSLEPAGASAVVPMLGEPRRASDIELTFWLSIEGARERLEITTPYLVPRPALVEALGRAARRGVEVRLLVPGEHNDSRFVHWLSRVFYRDLLATGVRVFEYRTTMMHAKALTVDREWAVIGSANFDNRSFELNYESNLLVVDGGLTATLRETFEADLAEAREVTPETLRAEPAYKTVLGGLLLLLRNQL
jgi:cardiolipin synthase